MKFSNREIIDLIKAWFFISLAFSILFSNPLKNFSLYSFFLAFLLSSLTLGFSFLLHELAHKFLAQKYHCKAEFFAFPKMLYLSVLMSFLGFIIAIPGAVFIHGRISREQNGKISLAGPLVNIALAIIFFLLLFLPFNNLKMLFTIGFSINSWLAIFNILPIGNFDGRKVYDWNKNVYFVASAIALILMAISYIV